MSEKWDTVKLPKVWKCGCTAPRKAKIVPCGTHNHGSSRILIDRLRRLSGK